MTTFLLQYLNALINSSVVVSAPDYLDRAHKLFGLRGRFWRSHVQPGSDHAWWPRMQGCVFRKVRTWAPLVKHHPQSLHNQGLTQHGCASSVSGLQVKSQGLILSQGKTVLRRHWLGSRGELLGTAGSPALCWPQALGDLWLSFVLLALFGWTKTFKDAPKTNQAYTVAAESLKCG